MSGIYTQSISGAYRKIKNYASMALLSIYFFGSWLRWSREGALPDQAIMIDLPNRKGYLFGIEIWPEEVYYVTGILICAALGLFFATSLFGRIWCGYTCPHTVYVDLFIKIEAFFQGDRNARIKLDQAEWDFDKIKAKLFTHLSWLGVGFTFAFGWVCYFYGAPELVVDIAKFKVTSDGLTWLVGLTLSTYLFAGFVREKVCTFMCPYGRFQSAMLDNDSYVVTYHDWRGEPRGKPNDGASGDCIDCFKCVYVCPMGIDIRDGLQMKCIGCGLCVDACNTVMDKLGRKQLLIGYDSVNSTQAKMAGVIFNSKIFRSKTVLFASIFAIVCSVMAFALANKPILSLAVLPQRDVLFTVLPDGATRNTYALKLSNRTSVTRDVVMTVERLDNAQIKVQGYSDFLDKIELTIVAEDEMDTKLFIKVPEGTEIKHKQEVLFVLTDKKTGKRITKDIVFIMTE